MNSPKFIKEIKFKLKSISMKKIPDTFTGRVYKAF